MTDSNGVRPSNDDTPDAPAVVVGAPGEIWLTFGDLSEFNGCQVEYADASRASDVSWCEEQIETSDVKYIRADLAGQRRQQLASVPAELVRKWYSEACKLYGLHDHDDRATEYVANKAAAYGRRQSQWVPVSERLPEPVRRLLDYAGKQRRDVSNPCITAREAIEIANWIQAAAYGRGQQVRYVRANEVPHGDASVLVVPCGPDLYLIVQLPEPPTC